MATATSADATDLTGFQRDILTVLAGGEEYGLAIKRALGDRYGDEVNHGRLYPNLDRLADAGLVTKRALDDRTNGYSLTDRGRDVVRRQAQRWVNAADGLGGADDA